MISSGTMVPNAEEFSYSLRHRTCEDGLFKIAEDPRITRVGRLLRRARWTSSRTR